MKQCSYANLKQLHFFLLAYMAKTTPSLIRDLLFADDAALVAHSESSLQEMMDQLSQACKAFSLIISVQKTVISTQEGTPKPSIRLDSKTQESVTKF